MVDINRLVTLEITLTLILHSTNTIKSSFICIFLQIKYDRSQSLWVKQQYSFVFVSMFYILSYIQSKKKNMNDEIWIAVITRRYLRKT